MCDKDVCLLLSNWGFADIIPQFFCEKIDHATLVNFNCLQPDPLIEQLFPSEKRRILFLNQLQIYQDLLRDNIPIIIENSTTDKKNVDNDAEEIIQEVENYKRPNSEPQSEIVEIIPKKVQLLDLQEPQFETENPFLHFYDLNLVQLLKRTNSGHSILVKYHDKVLPGDIRAKIVDIIINSLMERPILGIPPSQHRLQNHHFAILTQKFCQIFTKEDPHTYYVPPKTDGKEQKISRGKFPDKYRNWQIAQSKLGLLERGRKTTEGDVEDYLLTPAEVSDEHIQWLLNNNAPWRSVISHWQQSTSIRLTEFKVIKGSVSAIFEKYAVLKQPCGYELIESDFTFEKGRQGTLYTQWPELSKKLYQLMKTEIKDHAAKELFETLVSPDISQEIINLKLLVLLPALCPPVCRVRKSGSKSVWKPTIQESLDSFILHIEDPGNIDKALRDMREKYATFGIQVQPLVIVVGPTLSAPTAFYVNIDNTKYRFPSILAAVDLCFKSFHVLHAEYPKASEQVWLFLQKAVYSMKTKWDRQLSSVATLVTAIKNVELEISEC